VHFPNPWCTETSNVCYYVCQCTGLQYRKLMNTSLVSLKML
jgi:hypothetical protein